MEAYIIWILIAIACLIVEITTGTLYVLCFSIGAAFTIPFALLGLNWYVQVIVFAIISTLSIFFLRPIALKYMHNKERKSNADALIGRTGKVVETIKSNDYGRVAIDGDVWKAKTSDGKEIEIGQTVKVVDRESIIITVVNIN